MSSRQQVIYLKEKTAVEADWVMEKDSDFESEERK